LPYASKRARHTFNYDLINVRRGTRRRIQDELSRLTKVKKSVDLGENVRNTLYRNACRNVQKTLAG
jgi:prophage DNA circulation protein